MIFTFGSKVGLKNVENHSSILNQAYKTLKEPLNRAKHLFKVKCDSSFETHTCSEQNSEINSKMFETDLSIEEAKNSKESKVLREIQQELEINSEIYENNFVTEILKKNCEEAYRYLVLWNFSRKRIDSILDLL